MLKGSPLNLPLLLLEFCIHCTLPGPQLALLLLLPKLQLLPLLLQVQPAVRMLIGTCALAAASASTRQEHI